MKKILRNNQVIITALAIMIAVAGYLNFSDIEAETNGYGQVYEALDISDEDLAELKSVENTNAAYEENELAKADKSEKNSIEDNTKDSIADNKSGDSKDEDSIDDNKSSDSKDEGSITDNKNNKEEASEDKSAEVNEEGVGEAVLVSSNINLNYFYTAKLNREQLRAKNQESLMEIVESDTVTEEQKQEALNEIINITSNAEKESAAETLIEAKGFENAVVSIVDDGVDVVIDAESLTEQQVAQIEDIVKRKTGCENIVITPVNSQTPDE